MTVPVLPHTNALLLSVTARSTGDSYRGPATAGPERWAAAGDVRVWVEEGAEEKAAKGDVSTLEPSLMSIEASSGVLVELGDAVTYRRDRDGAEVTRRVRAIDRLDVAGLVNVTFWET